MLYSIHPIRSIPEIKGTTNQYARSPLQCTHSRQSSRSDAIRVD